MGKVKANIQKLSKQQFSNLNSYPTLDNGKSMNADVRKRNRDWRADNTARWNKVIEEAMKENERRFPT